MGKRLAIVLVLCAALSPAFSIAQLAKPGEATQIRLGEHVAEDLRRQEKILPADDPRVIELRKVATSLLSTLHDNEPWHFSFDVIDSPEINAFSLPGGPTFFYTGLLDKLKTEDELAGVLGHELTHVRKQHWAIQYAATQRRDLLIDLGLMVSHANQDIASLADVSDQMIFSLPFSRSEEAQADDGGFDMMAGAGYNPIAMAHVFQMMQDTIRDGNPPEWLNDHPADAKRIKHIEDRIAKSGQTFPAERHLDF